ncbi:MAG: glycoside hydrolase family 2 protein [Lentimicrobiaceae bacterium]|jgi:beta-mannosidase|nr:glycoside hydrolase family 2 protein [Lentimicrobiaceae bacterium]MBT3453489.1 glycoside hydrolase family 2 protein [Lentimicrobiaceae bacterium]MBT4062255.1 glycoside hydrolase family 2 protein [Lentimicrobiaceae bacterium]MBT4191215.1 glycoside hydrolase family 2 protein [Lentimicrobiaceae bacterium]MBT4467410.1 glycoside hydrolase family 2 protein [Lentimicrobiaceae bacterium]
MRYFRSFVFLTFLLGLIINSCSSHDTLKETIIINQNWTFKNISDSIWMPADVPGTVHTDLINNNIIEDPYYRLNERNVQWVDKTDWEYRSSFFVGNNLLSKDVIELRLNGIDTHSDIYINGNKVIETNNMFTKWIVDCKKYLKYGKNSIKVILRSAINIGLDKRAKLGFTLPGAENDQSEIGGLGDTKVCVFSRKPGYHFGWDWGPRLVTSGIWQNIELVAWNLANIDNIYIKQNKIDTEIADLEFTVEIESVNKKNITLITLIDDSIINSRKINLIPGFNNISYPITISSPELWWPNGHGDQRLYNVEIQLRDNENLISKKNQSLGLRTIEVVQDKDSIGASFYFKVNGFPVFMKGANYIPQDIFLNRPSNEDYNYLINSAKDANFNMLRVWGGGIYEKDIFYDLCDKAGILVWQDFMFACAMYPGNEEFLENVKREAIQNVKRLRSHPSIAIWCGDNEILSAWNRWGWKEDVYENQGADIVDSVWYAYEDIFHKILPKVVEAYDSTRLYWSSSPSSGFGELENGKSGDNHYWGVWWGKEPFDKYEEFIPRFMSEFGFQSFPTFKSVKKYTTEEDWNIYSPVMKSHQRSSIGNATIEEYMKRDYHIPENFEEFLYVGQLLQAKGIKMGIEAQRRAMPYCMGSLYWQLNDCWPVASWSSIDYYGNWKALHYEVRNAFKEVIISTEIRDDNLNLYIVSDKLLDTEATLELTLMDFNGKIIKSINEDIIINANSSKVYNKVDISSLTNNLNKSQLLLLSKIKSKDSVIIDLDITYFVSPKNLLLTSPKIDYEILDWDKKSFVIEVSTDVLAKNVFLQYEAEGQFSDNYFDIPPNESVRIIFSSDMGLDTKNIEGGISIISLTDTYDN